MASRAEFLVAFPEFTNTNSALVEAKLASAARQIDQEVWGDKATDGIYYLAAHQLALSPYGNNAELVANGGKTTYKMHYDDLVRQVASGFRVA